MSQNLYLPPGCTIKDLERNSGCYNECEVCGREIAEDRRLCRSCEREDKEPENASHN